MVEWKFIPSRHLGLAIPLMMTHDQSRLLPRTRRICAFSAAAVGTLGLSVLVGWAIDAPVLKSVSPHWVTMKANTALAFLLLGLSLGLQRREERSRVARACALLAAGIGLGTLAEYALGRDLGIDELLFREGPGAVATSSPGRMAPTTAAAFALFGTALAFLNVETRRGLRPAPILGLVAGSIALLSFLGYALGASTLSPIAAYTQMAVHTAAAFLLLHVGILCARPRHGMMILLMSAGPGGFLARRLLVGALLVPAGLAWLRLLGERADLYDAGFGIALLIMLIIAILSVLVVRVGSRLDRTAAERAHAEERFRSVAQTATDAVVTADAQGRIAFANPAAERMFRMTAEEATGRPLTILMPDRFHEAHRKGLERYLATGEARVLGKTLELMGRRKDGSEFPLEISISSWKSGGETYFTGILRDIAERKQAEEELRSAKERAEAAYRELESFSYSVSHDLRAPLRAVDGFSQAVLEDCAPRLDESGKRYLERLRAASQRMGLLIDDMLELSKVSRKELRREEVDLAEIARAVAEDLRRTRPERDVEFVLAPEARATGDPTLLRAVVENLMENAWKFTSKHPRARIEFGVTEAEGRRTFFVRDDGAGFDPTYAAKLFGPFHRLHGESEFPGTGIGLATVRRIVHRHGGRVWAEGAPEKGATFYFAV